MTMWIRSCLVLLVTVLCVPTLHGQPSASALPRKVLFIGDSFTYYQGGIYTHVEKLAAANEPAIVVATDKAVAGGAFLERLWKMQEPVTAINSGAFDVVVLQDDI